MRTSRKHISRILFVAVIIIAATLIFSADTFAATAKNATGYVNSWNGAYLRSGAGTSYSKVALLYDNTKLTITRKVFVTTSSTSSTNAWYQVSVNKKSGYIRSDLVDNIKYTAVNGKATDYLNYRVGAGTGMTRKGTLAKGAGLQVFLMATAKGSNVTWYMVKVGTTYYYVCGTWVSVTDSIFVNPTPTSKPAVTPTPKPAVTPTPKPADPTPSTETPASEVTPAVTTDFESSLSSQGFPEDYKVLLRKLHSTHPNWVFLSKKTGISFSDAVAKENANGVSLVSSSLPISYRSTDSNSFKISSPRTIYSKAGGGSKLGSLTNTSAFTVYDEVFVGTTQWTHIKSSDGITGYISGAFTTESYQNSMNGVLTDWVNIRKGAGTNCSIITTLSPNTKIDIVLQAKDSSSKIWYKLKYNSSYAYITSEYVKVTSKGKIKTNKTVEKPSDKYPFGTANTTVDYKAAPGNDFPSLGNIAKGTQITILGKFVLNDTEWYQIVQGQYKAYCLASKLDIAEGTEITEIVSPFEFKGVATDYLNYRLSAGVSMALKGMFNKGDTVTVIEAVKSGKEIWYKVKIGTSSYYSSSDYITLNRESAPKDSLPITETMVVELEAAAKPSELTGTATVVEGTYIPKDGSTWFNACTKAVEYYLDPRNFLNEDRVYMFEDETYHKEYQTVQVVNKVLEGTQLPKYGFNANLFVEASAANNISPVTVAARARQETGGGSDAINGSSYNGRIVYNPFNIGAYSSSNPLLNGLKYAYNAGWFTPRDAVYGGASFLAKDYISKGQNSLYFQRFNVANGLSKVGTHQYMTNLTAPYSESYSTKTSYSTYGISNEALTFIIPIYNNMPSKTTLP